MFSMRKNMDRMAPAVPIALILLMLITTGINCASGGLDPNGDGVLYTDVRANYHCRSADSGCVAPAAAKPIGQKVGQACHINVFFYTVSLGDKSLLTAARDGGIQNVEVVEYSYLKILDLGQIIGGISLPLYVKDCLIVSGT